MFNSGLVASLGPTIQQLLADIWAAHQGRNQQLFLSHAPNLANSHSKPPEPPVIPPTTHTALHKPSLGLLVAAPLVFSQVHDQICHFSTLNVHFRV